METFCSASSSSQVLHGNPLSAKGISLNSSQRLLHIRPFLFRLPLPAGHFPPSAPSLYVRVSGVLAVRRGGSRNLGPGPRESSYTDKKKKNLGGGGG